MAPLRCARITPTPTALGRPRWGLGRYYRYHCPALGSTNTEYRGARHAPGQAAGALCRPQHRRRAPGAVAVVAAGSAGAAPPTEALGGPTVVWFKHDLRLDDHPGLQAALELGAPLLPVYCFDPEQYAHLLQLPGGVAGLRRAVQSLQQSLRRLGSDLVVLCGPWQEQLPALAAAAGASTVVAEREVEWRPAAGAAAVRGALPPGVRVREWSAPLFAEFVDNFKELKRRRPGVNPPLDPPAALPPLPEAQLAAWREQQVGSGHSGELPNVEQLEQAARTCYAGSLDPRLAESAAAWAALPAEWLQTMGAESSSSSVDEEAGAAAARVINRMPPAGFSPDGPSSSGAAGESGAGRGRGALWEAELAAELAAGEGAVMSALAAYLRDMESGAAAAAGGGGSNEWAAQLRENVARHDIPAAPDGSFPALFTRALALGVVSRRRLYHEALRLLRPQQAQQEGALAGLAALLSGLLPGAGGAGRSARKAAAALAAAEARDFHEQMAAQRQDRAVHGAQLRHWRWRGVLTDYLEAAPPAGAPARPGAPAILLVHGFGAFSEQWRDNAAALAAAGYHVYAPTMPGYGRSEKPSLTYGQDLWRDFLHDFALAVVRRPVVVAGNSIGGFMAASLAADYPGLAQGLVLLNSAGLLIPDYEPPTEQPAASPPPPFVVNAVSQGLFSFLEGSVENQLRRLYPVRPERADPWLAGEIARAAADPGALGVFRSVFYLPRPRPLSYLVGQVFGGPTLVLQGAKDPLNDALGRARLLEQLCPNVEVKLLEAGHCPHDEVPEQVNQGILEFVEGRVLRRPAAAGQRAVQEAAAP